MKRGHESPKQLLETESEHADTESILVVLCSKSIFSCVFYDPAETRTVFVLYSTIRDGYTSLVKTILLQEQPDTVITHCGSETELLESLEEERYTRQTLVVSYRDYTHGTPEIEAKVSSILSEEKKNRTAQCCVRALLNSLDRAGRVFPDRSREMKMAEHLILDTETLYSLDVFAKGRDAEASQKPSCIFDLLKKTRTRIGAQVLRRWLARPLKDIAEIKKRHDGIEWLRKETQKSSFIRERLSALSGFSVSFLYQQAVPSAAQFKKTAQFIEGLFSIRKTLAENIDGEYLRSPVPDLLPLCDEILSTVDFEESSRHGRCCVRGGVSSVLDGLKDRLGLLPDLFSQAGEEFASSLGIAGDVRVVYYPHVGCLVGVPSGEEEELVGKRLEFVFRTPVESFFKADQMRVLDADIGDVYGEIVDAETDVVQRLFERVREFKEELIAGVEFVGEIDGLQSFEEASRTYTRPTVTNRREIVLVSSRNALQEACADGEFVPNTVEITEERPTMFLTGPNGSGKSVVLRQIGQAVILAQAGCFIPAEAGSIIGVADNLFTRIKTKDTVTEGRSTFLTDILQAKRAVCCSTPQSLVLLDEFGKGTKLENGIGLYCSILFYLTRNKTRTVAVSHFLEIIHNGFLSGISLQVCFSRMAFAKNSDGISYLFRLEEGVSTDSLGSVCGANAGLPQNVVSRYNELKAGCGVEGVFPLDSKEKKCVELFSGLKDFSKENIRRLRRILSEPR
ncbi:MAG: DNA mismatch repair protein Msh5 [Amphiamblys sp. WSBS2006]|nr:MAG: DNA mismatch repair protein Msh5 [Amphiamblys sp. WSBS2006]